MQQPICVVTCDIVASRQYQEAERRAVDSLVPQRLEETARILGVSTHTPMSFRTTAGDEFQYVLDEPEQALRFVVLHRCLVGLAKFDNPVGFRASLGLGSFAVDSVTSTYQMDGIAFHLSRKGLERLVIPSGARKQRRLTQLVVGHPLLDKAFDTVLMYMDMLEAGWSRAQREAAAWRLQQLTYEQIGERIGISYQNVQKRLRAAGWREFEGGLEFVESIIRAHPKEGEVWDFTRLEV